MKTPHGYWKDTQQFRFEYCLLCKTWTIICWKCNNNCCNASYGILKNGKICDVCPEAHEWQEQYWNERPQGLKSSILIFFIWLGSRGRMIKHFIKHGTFNWYGDYRWGKYSRWGKKNE